MVGGSVGTRTAIRGISNTYEIPQALKAVGSGWEHFSCSQIVPAKSRQKQEYNYADGLAASVHSWFSQTVAESSLRLQARSPPPDPPLDATVRGHVNIVDFCQRGFQSTARLEQF